jgi:hypothetical protein
MGWALPSPARTNPAHGPKKFFFKTMGWAGLMRFLSGFPWAGSFGPRFKCLIKNSLTYMQKSLEKIL